jgi:hypothetical protein
MGIQHQLEVLPLQDALDHLPDIGPANGHPDLPLHRLGGLYLEHQVFLLPMIGLLSLGANVAIGLPIYLRDRVGAYLLWSGALVVQALAWIAALGILPAAEAATPPQASLGTAVVEACRDAKAQLIRKAMQLLDKTEGEVEYSNGIFTVKGNPDQSVTLAKVARSTLFSQGEGPIVGRGSVGMPPYAPMIAVHAAEVEVDPETGKVKVLTFVAAYDSGKVINPMLAEGQIEGALQQGIGYALCEEMASRMGR